MTDFLALLPQPLLPLIPLGLSFAVVIVAFLLPDRAKRARGSVNLSVAAVKLLVIIAFVPAVVDGRRPEFRATVVPNVDLVLRVEPLSLLFAGLSSILWLLTTLYANGYLARRSNQARFFGFFALCITATVGISFSGNLFTFLLFFELLTLATYPLVIHKADQPSMRAGRTYLGYTYGGGLALFVGVVWLTALVGDVSFTDGGADAVAELARTSPGVATAIFALLIVGVGVKAAIVPLHAWLPRAMVAPAPVSALLHAVAVVKAGVFGMLRIVDDVFGVSVASALGVLTPLLVIGAITVIYGSVVALMQSDLKKRLAYSTISQVSYITIGIGMASVMGTTGAIMHLIHQGLMKITLFFCAGLFAEVHGVKSIAGLAGMGRRMPWTCASFTVGAFGMIGLPPLAGFITKWHLGLGAVESGHTWVLGIIIASALLNSAYFLPPVYRMWFLPVSDDSEGGGTEGEATEPGDATEHEGTEGEATEHEGTEPGDATEHEGTEPGDDGPGSGKRWLFREAPGSLLVPALATAVFSIGVGVLAASPYSPLSMARGIAEGVFAP